MNVSGLIFLNMTSSFLSHLKYVVLSVKLCHKFLRMRLKILKKHLWNWTSYSSSIHSPSFWYSCGVSYSCLRASWDHTGKWRPQQHKLCVLCLLCIIPWASQDDRPSLWIHVAHPFAVVNFPPYVCSYS